MLWGHYVLCHGENDDHAHDLHELVVVLSDAGRHWVEDQCCELRAGQTVFLPGGVRHRLGGYQGQPAEIVYVCFPPRYFLDNGDTEVNELVSRLEAERAFFSASTPDIDADVLRIGQRLRHELDAVYPLKRLMISSLLTQLLVFHSRTLAVTHPPAHDESGRRIDALRRRIIAAPDGVYSLDDVAADVGMCRTLFCREFRRVTGTTLTAFVNSCRIHRAMHRLADSPDSVDTIAAASGFRNLGHFYTTFREYCGLTPRAYRRRCRFDATSPATLRVLERGGRGESVRTE